MSRFSILASAHFTGERKWSGGFFCWRFLYSYSVTADFTGLYSSNILKMALFAHISVTNVIKHETALLYGSGECTVCSYLIRRLKIKLYRIWNRAQSIKVVAQSYFERPQSSHVNQCTLCRQVISDTELDSHQEDHLSLSDAIITNWK